MVLYDTPGEGDKNIERDVRIACIIEIKKRLKHPDSMKIISRSVLPVDENKWIVEIDTKAKNDFGIMVPLNFVYSVHLKDGNYKLKILRDY